MQVNRASNYKSIVVYIIPCYSNTDQLTNSHLYTSFNFNTPVFLNRGFVVVNAGTRQTYLITFFGIQSIGLNNSQQHYPKQIYNIGCVNKTNYSIPF